MHCMKNTRQKKIFSGKILQDSGSCSILDSGLENIPKIKEKTYANPIR